MKKGKTGGFAFVGFFIVAILVEVFQLPLVLAVLLGYIGGIGFCYSVMKFGWIDSFKAYT